MNVKRKEIKKQLRKLNKLSKKLFKVYPNTIYDLLLAYNNELERFNSFRKKH